MVHGPRTQFQSPDIIIDSGSQFSQLNSTSSSVSLSTFSLLSASLSSFFVSLSSSLSLLLFLILPLSISLPLFSPSLPASLSLSFSFSPPPSLFPSLSLSYYLPLSLSLSLPPLSFYLLSPPSSFFTYLSGGSSGDGSDNFNIGVSLTDEVTFKLRVTGYVVPLEVFFEHLDTVLIIPDITWRTLRRNKRGRVCVCAFVREREKEGEINRET